MPLQKLRELQIETISISHRLMTEADEIESSWNLVKGLIELTKSLALDCIAPCIEAPVLTIYCWIWPANYCRVI